ncbi:hypothetical protein [Kitasatospora sp. NPDC001225]
MSAELADVGPALAGITLYTVRFAGLSGTVIAVPSIAQTSSPRHYAPVVPIPAAGPQWTTTELAHRIR